MEYEVQRFTRHCAATGRQLQPGEPFYSVLIQQGAETRRLDYSAEAWQGPPPEAIAWWKSYVPGKHPHPHLRWAPNEVLLDYFEQLEEQPTEWDKRYILGLLLLRRRVFRLEESVRTPQGEEILLLDCPRRQRRYELRVIAPGPERAKAIQEELIGLLGTGGPAR